MANTNLHKAKKAKNDEFYTQLEDISKEVSYYKNHFEGKIVLCNCDDPEWSNFWKFFHDVFNDWNLKKLISTHYNMDGSSSYALFFDGNEVTKKELVGNGDFASEECIEFLKEADIVVTNPPFSLFRKYVALLMEYEKKFIIWGNNNSITYKEIFPLIKENKMWLGYMANKTCIFRLSDDYEKYDETITKQMNDGHRYGKVPAISVFTNLDIPKRHKPLIPELKYSYEKHPEWYPKYDNYDAINVGYIGDDEKLQRQTNKVSYIPYDYKGVMGVPITFLDKYNPDEFEIIELGNSRDNFTPNKDYINPQKHTKENETVNGGAINCVLAIEQDICPVNIVYYTSDNSKYLVSPYARILIQRKEISENEDNRNKNQN